MRGDGTLGCHTQGLVGNYQLSSFVRSPGISYINLVLCPPTSSLLGQVLKVRNKANGPDILPVAEMDLQRWPPAPSPQQDGGDSSLCDGPVLQGCCMLIWPIVSGWLLSQCLRTKGLCVDLCFALFNIYIWILAWLQRKDIKAAAKKGILLSAFDGRILRRDLCRCFEVCDSAQILVSASS